jgi:hypothetical protein
MLMTVLKGEQATAQSIALIRLFKQMKDYIQEILNTDELGQIPTTRKIRAVRQEG